jgi:uncharacterized repeat protein (TIGR02543 family)
MKKILAFLFAVSLFYFVGAQSVLASSNVNVESVSYFGPGNTTSANVSVGRGSPVTFNHSGVSAEYSFAFYAVNDIIRDDFPIGQQFVARKDMKLTAVFYPNGSVTPANARHVVVFADASSKIIDIQYVVDGGDASEPNPSLLPPMPAFAKYSATKWLTSANISDLTGITSNRVYFLQYDLDTTTQFTVSVASGSGDGSYLYNTVVTATPDAPEGENIFSHWEDAEGNVLSYKENYKFTVLSNVSITAIYSASPVSAMPVVNMSDALALRDDYVSYKGQFDIPAALSLVEYGFIFSRSSDVLTLDSLGATVVPSNVHNGQTGEFLRSFPNDTFNSVRAYLIVKNTSEQEVIVYSDNYEKMLFTTSSYTTGFENVNPAKGSYAAGETTSDGIIWNLSDALIGNLANDRKNGSFSARIQASGFIETKTLQNNINNISFLTAKYGNDGDAKLFVAVSSNGTNWIDVTDGINAAGVDVTSTTLTQVSINLLDSSNYVSSGLSSASGLYVKISKTGGTRINIDDVEISMKSYPDLHEVIYNNATPSSENILDGQTITNTAPTQAGYSFAGWYTDVALTQSYNASSPVLQSLQLYAKWTINEYTITFISAGGSAVSPITQDYNTSVVAPGDPTREGYSFTGWSPAVPSNMPANNLELTAQWSINQYTITFDSNEGSAVSAITQDFGTSVSEPLDPTREGYLFQGWFTDDNTFLNEYVFSTMPSQNVTVYAKWEELSGIEYNVAFDLNGGFGSIDSQVVPENGTATEPSNPIQSGYRFVEWQLLGSTFNFATPITANITLTAVWIQQFTVTFNVDGGSSVAAQVVDNGSYAITPDPSPTKSGSTFGGWYADETLTTAFIFESTQITENKVVYAKWDSTLTTTFLGSSMSTAVGTTSNTQLTDGLAYTTPNPDIDYASGFGLDTAIFDVSLAKNSASAFAINAGVLRGYYNAAGGGAITISTISSYSILSITINIKGADATGSNSLTVNGTTYNFSLDTKTSTTSINVNDLNSSSIIIQSTSSKRMYIESIVISYQLNP